MRHFHTTMYMFVACNFYFLSVETSSNDDNNSNFYYFYWPSQHSVWNVDDNSTSTRNLPSYTHTYTYTHSHNRCVVYVCTLYMYYYSIHEYLLSQKSCQRVKCEQRQLKITRGKSAKKSEGMRARDTDFKEAGERKIALRKSVQ